LMSPLQNRHPGLKFQAFLPLFSSSKKPAVEKVFAAGAGEGWAMEEMGPAMKSTHSNFGSKTFFFL
jgi:hypothetical protein